MYFWYQINDLCEALLDKIAKIKNTAKRSNEKYIIDGHKMPIIEYPNLDE